MNIKLILTAILCKLFKYITTIKRYIFLKLMANGYFKNVIFYDNFEPFTPIPF